MNNEFPFSHSRLAPTLTGSWLMSYDSFEVATAALPFRIVRFALASLLLLITFVSQLSAQTPDWFDQKRSRVCSHCGAQVALFSQVGQTCPHCGAYWNREVDSAGREVDSVRPYQKKDVPKKDGATPPPEWLGNSIAIIFTGIFFIALAKNSRIKKGELRGAFVGALVALLAAISIGMLMPTVRVESPVLVVVALIGAIFGAVAKI